MADIAQRTADSSGGYMEPEFDIRYYLAILRRRYLYVLIPAVFIAVGAVAYAYWLPPVYEASATILVESQQIPTDLAAPTVTSNAGGRIQVIEQRLLTRDNLLQIATKFDLFAYEGDQRTPTTIVDNIRAAVSIDRIDLSLASRANTDVIGFTVKFKYRDATIASRVTNEFVSSILSQNIEARMTRASDTSKFFEQQQKDIETRLLEFETKIADFKKNNDDTLPETLPARRIQLAQITAQISEVEQRIRSAGLSSNLTALDTNSSNAQQLSYTLQAKQIELNSYREERDQLAPLLEKGFVPQNRIRDLDRSIALAELNVASLNAQIAAQGGIAPGEDAVKLLQSLKEELQAQVAVLSESISKTPVVEVELNAMTRDYENLQAEYRQTQARLEDALTGERLEQDRQAERFEVIEQATAPDKPTEPNRPKIVTIGSFAGVAAGLGLLVLIELLNKRLYSAEDLEKKLQIRPIGTIPYVTTSREVRLKGLRNVVIFASAIGLLAVSLILFNYYFMPLDLVFDRILTTASRLLARSRSSISGT